jgi:hypothetical protein
MGSSRRRRYSPVSEPSVAASSAGGPSTPGTPGWTLTGNMTTPRPQRTATLLRDSKVLVAGAGAGGRSAELYDPAARTWTATGKMVSSGATATLLPDGKVLVAGGWDVRHSGFQPQPGLASAELYDPASGTWTATASKAAPRLGQTAMLLRDGTVLAAGGSDNGLLLASAELFDLGSGQ